MRPVESLIFDALWAVERSIGEATYRMSMVLKQERTWKE